MLSELKRQARESPGTMHTFLPQPLCRNRVRTEDHGGGPRGETICSETRCISITTLTGQKTEETADLQGYSAYRKDTSHQLFGYPERSPLPSGPVISFFG